MNKMEVELDEYDVRVFEAQYSADRKLCPFAAEVCFASRDAEIFSKVCSDNHGSCSSFAKNCPVSKGGYDAGNYIISFVKGGEMAAISGVMS